jgi:hypothetical protein
MTTKEAAAYLSGSPLASPSAPSLCLSGKRID